MNQSHHTTCPTCLTQNTCDITRICTFWLGPSSLFLIFDACRIFINHLFSLFLRGMFFVLITKDAPPSSACSSPLCLRQGHAPYSWQNILKSQLYNDCMQYLKPRADLCEFRFSDQIREVMLHVVGTNSSTSALPWLCTVYSAASWLVRIQILKLNSWSHAPYGGKEFFKVIWAMNVCYILSRELTCANSNSQIEFSRSCSVWLARIFQSHLYGDCTQSIKKRDDEFNFSDQILEVMLRVAGRNSLKSSLRWLCTVY